MNRSLNPLLIGAAAGAVAAAILSVGSAVPPVLSFLLFVLSPLPLMLAGLGWGPVAGLMAAAACVLAIASFAGPPPAIVIALSIALPATTLAYVGGMARIDNGQAREWYPLGHILFLATAMVAAGFAALGVYVDFPAASSELSAELVKRLAAAGPAFSSDPAATTALANSVVNLAPFQLPASWLLVVMGNFWLALSVSRRSGVFRRPKDDWPSSLKMPAGALPPFALAMAGTFLGGGLGMIAWCVAGAFSTAFVITGFAALHRMSRGKPWRMTALWIAYATSLTIGLPLLAFLFAGLYDTAKKPAADGGKII
jgi:hypothetical protein